MIKRIIKASAGTGKTYQLSIEYLSLLILGVNYEEILVVTFTRKATAQIRTRIFSQLKLLISHLSDKPSKDGEVLLNSLSQNLLIDHEINLKKLKDSYQKMLMNKQKVKIYTIDSFINSIFSNLIAPFLNLNDFAMIDEEQNKDIYSRVLMILLDDTKKWLILKEYILLNPNQKSITKYTEIIEQILKNRWFLETIEEQDSIGKVGIHDIKEIMDSMLNKLMETVASVSIILKSGFQFIDEYNKDRELKHFERMLMTHMTLFLSETNFWLSRAVKEDHENLLEEYKQFVGKFAVYSFAIKIKPFQKQLLKLSKLIYEEYDKIKMKEKLFTYQDILYFTYKYLYSKELSFIDPENQTVINYFYEMMTNKITYVLIDEFQDTSLIQWQIIVPMINEIISDESKPGGIICVGDEKQAIYGWRGGEQGLLKNLPNILSITDTSSLQTSYRSTPEVINFINAYFQKTSDLLSKNQYLQWSYQKVSAFRSQEKGYVEVVLDKKEKSEESEESITKFVHFVQQKIKEKSLKLSETAVIVRRNKEMDEIAELFEEIGLKYIIESSASVLDSPAIKTLLYVLQFIAYKDIFELIKFLRSDLIDISSKEMKEILVIYNSLSVEKKHNMDEYLNIVCIKNVLEVLSQVDLNAPLFEIISDIIKYFNIVLRFNTEYDAKNIVRFLEIVENYCTSNANSKKDMQDLIFELNKNRHCESYRQVGVATADSIQIITIHKAKGLEFNNVFFYWDIGQKTSVREHLQISTRYNNKYNRLEEYVFYKAEDKNIINSMDRFTDLLKFQEEKEFNEEINNIYVALTRARTNLFLFTVVGKKVEEIDKKIKSLTGKKTDDMYYVFKESILSAINACSGENIQLKSLEDLLKTNYQYGEYNPVNDHPQKLSEGPTGSKLFKYFRTQSSVIETDKKMEEKVLYAKEQFIYSQQIGNTVHEYLSFIKYNREDERQAARKMVFHKYGVIFNHQTLKEILDRVDGLINNELDVFSNRWTVFNEQIIFDGTTEYRIDRLLIDKKTKNILIIDYKTGEEKDIGQLDTYVKIISNLNFVKGKGYRIQAEFLEINLLHPTNPHQSGNKDNNIK